MTIVRNIAQGSIMLVLMFAAIYMAPTLLAAALHHKNWAIIALFNFLLGWTIIGWLLVLIYAAYSRADAGN